MGHLKNQFFLLIHTILYFTHSKMISSHLSYPSCELFKDNE